MNEIIGANEEIQIASTLLQSISQDDYERAKFLSKRKFENDMESERNTAIKIRLREVAGEMLKYGDSIEKTSEITRLSVKEIEEL